LSSSCPETGWADRRAAPYSVFEVRIARASRARERGALLALPGALTERLRPVVTRLPDALVLLGRVRDNERDPGALYLRKLGIEAFPDSVLAL